MLPAAAAADDGTGVDTLPGLSLNSEFLGDVTADDGDDIEASWRREEKKRSLLEPDDS